VKDTLEGKYCPRALQSQAADPVEALKKPRRVVGMRESIQLLALCVFETLAYGQLHILLFTAIPHYMSCVGLSYYGHKFDYICAAKPKSQVMEGIQDIETCTSSEGHSKITSDAESSVACMYGKPQRVSHNGYSPVCTKELHLVGV